MPIGRSDLALGGAVRVPTGDLAPEAMGDDADQALRYGAPGGAVPVAFFRYGFGDDADLGVEASGTTLRAMLRGRLRLGGFASLMGAIVPHLGVAHDGSAAVRGGGTLPVVVGFDVLSVLEIWLGVRGAIDHLGGELAGGDTVSLTGVRTGGVVGVAAGFRRLHVLVELGIDHELWLGELAGRSIERNGLALTPGFAVRLRL